MDENIARTIAGVKEFERLATLEANIRAKGKMTDEIEAALRSKGTDLGRDLVAAKTGLDLSELTPAEEGIVRAISEYTGMKKRVGTNAGRTLDQVKRIGLIEAAEASVMKSKPTAGYEALIDADMAELSYEQIIVNHPHEFSPRATWYARRTLGLPNASDAPPARSITAAQSRTVVLLDWLRQRARDTGGALGAFTNTDAAHVLGMDDMSRHGRVFGNIQSRIDFACYRAGLPPLGLTAEAPFREAWGQENRLWAFPIASMQRAAQAFEWQDHDFDRVLVETEQLPGRAHIVWKQALATEPDDLRGWAEGLEAGPRRTAAPEPGSAPGTGGRNPDWTRDELILALEAYMRYRVKSFSKTSPEVAELSRRVRALATLRGLSGDATFRNTNGAYMKLSNFRAADPDYTSQGKSGLGATNSLEQEVWDTYSADPEALNAAFAALLEEIAGVEIAPEEPAEPEPAVEITATGERYWVFVCNPAKWAIDKFLVTGTMQDSWGIRPSDRSKFAPGQLGIVRVGVDRRNALAREGRPALEPGIYALCEVESEPYAGSGASDAYWAEDEGREAGWPTVRIRYLRTYLNTPLTLEALKTVRPDTSPWLLNGLQAASFPLPADDFRAILEMLDEDIDELPCPPEPPVDTVERIAELEAKFLNASPEVKTRVSKCIERGPIGNEVKKTNGYKCQLCEALGRDPLGFKKKNGVHYVEAHHVMPVSTRQIGVLSASNIMTLCANHHREMHYGALAVTILEDRFGIEVEGVTHEVPKAHAAAKFIAQSAAE